MPKNPNALLPNDSTVVHRGITYTHRTDTGRLVRFVGYIHGLDYPKIWAVLRGYPSVNAVEIMLRTTDTDEPNASFTYASSIIAGAIPAAPPKPLTNEEYVASRGVQCPHCQARDSMSATSAPQYDCEGACGVYTLVHCAACDAEWKDVYTLTGYTDALP